MGPSSSGAPQAPSSSDGSLRLPALDRDLHDVEDAVRYIDEVLWRRGLIEARATLEDWHSSVLPLLTDAPDDH